MIGVLVSGAGTNLQALIDAGLPIAPSRRTGATPQRSSGRARPAIPTAVFSLDCHADREERDLLMATWLEEHGVELRRARRLHAPADEAVPRPFPRADRQRPSVAAAGVPRRARDRRRARGGRRDDRRHGPRRRRGRRHAGRSCARSRCRSSRARRSRSGSTRSSTACCPRSSRLFDEDAMSALISVYDKDGLDGLRARTRRPRLRARLVAAGPPRSSRSTASTVTRVEEVTAAPEMLGGRVKTLHPRDPRRHPRAPRPAGGRATRSPSTRSSRSTSSASTSIRSRRSPGGAASPRPRRSR